MLTAALLTAVSKLVSATPQVDITSVLQFGLLGLIFMCVVFRKFIVPEWVLKDAEVRHADEVKEIRAERDAYKGQVEKLQGVFQDQMIPALTRSTEVAAAYNEELARKRWSQSLGPDPKL